MLERLLAPARLGKPSQFAVILRENGKLIGYCGFFLQMVDGVEEFEIGYRLDPEYWGRGMATEAARAVRDHAFRDLRAARVISLILPENFASRRVAEKNGMRLEKETTFRGFPPRSLLLRREEWTRRAQLRLVTTNELLGERAIGARASAVGSCSKIDFPKLGASLSRTVRGIRGLINALGKMLAHFGDHLRAQIGAAIEHRHDNAARSRDGRLRRSFAFARRLAQF